MVTRRVLARGIPINNGGQLVAGNQRLLHDERAIGTVEVVVEIGSTDADKGWLDADLVSSWFRHRNISDAQLERLAHPDLLVREGCQYHWYNPGYATFEDFLATLNSRRRKEIKRERRDVEAQGLDIELLEGEAITPAHWAVFHRFYCATFARKFGEPRLTRAFMEHLSREIGRAHV